MRILLVEDEPSAATMLAKGLREEAYAVDLAADGETALAPNHTIRSRKSSKFSSKDCGAKWTKVTR